MKVLYAIQGTGNGHLSRARDIIPLLHKKCEVDILVSGTQSEIELDHDIKYKFKGLGFVFGKKGGVDIWNTYIQANNKRLRNEMKSLPVEDYDFVINDFEPVSAWACYRRKVPCISLSHQAALLDKNVPKPNKKDFIGWFILKNYAPASYRLGIHFCKYSKYIYTPVIRKDIREAKNQFKNHYTVYLPSFGDDYLMEILSEIKNANWKVFSKHSKESSIYKNVAIEPVSNEGFIESMTSGTGVLCGAGFETPAEALFLGKKLMAIPMTNQYEQHFNAAALKAMGVPIIKKLKHKQIEKIQKWVDSDFKIEVNYPDITEKMVNDVFELHVGNLLQNNNWKEHSLIIEEDKE